MTSQRLHTVEQACTELAARGDPVTFVTVAQRTGIPRVTLYRNRPCAPSSKNTARAHATPPP